MFNFFKKKYAFKLTVPSEYRIFSLSPVIFCTGLMGNSGAFDFDIKIDGDYVYITPECLTSKMAVTIAKEFVFSKAIVLNDIIHSELDSNAFPPLELEINERVVDKDICKYFNTTMTISRNNIDNLRRLMTNRGVNFEEVDEEDESVY